MRTMRTIILTSLLLVCVFVVEANAAMTKDEIFLVFTQANEAFAQANKTDDSETAQELFQKAISSYERIIESGGIHNAKLYYNLGNSYLLSDDLGRAILNYRRAQRLDSSDPDIHKNLNFARSKRIDQFAVSAQKRIMERLFFWHWDFSMKTRFVVGGVCFALMCLWIVARIWIARWPAVIAVSIILFSITAAMLCSVGIELRSFSTDRSGVIVADSVVARQGDSENYPKSFNEPLHSGVEFDVIEQRLGWLHIQLSNEQDTWIPEDAAELLD